MRNSQKRLSAVPWTAGLLAANLILAISIGGCVTPDGTKVVSLEEAKKITGTFEGRGFAPPPRTINDITRVLARETPEDLQFFQKSLETANTKPPDTTDPLKLAKFYLQRAHAAHEVGRAKQEIEDYGLAVRHGKQSGFSCLWVAMTGLAAAEERAGSLSRAVEVIEELLSHLAKGSNMQGNTAVYCGVKAFYCVRKGDLAAAQQAVKQAEMAATETENWPHGLWRNAMNSTICRARASVLEAMGNLTDAEAQYTKAVALWEPLKDERARECDTPKLNPRVYNLEVYELGQNLLRQGRLVEAEIQARKALTGALRSHGRYSAHTAVVIQGLNDVIFEQGRYEEAEALARANVAICSRTETARASTTLAFTRSTLADSLLAQMRWKDALTEYDRVCEGLVVDRTAYENFVANRVNLWLSLIKGGRESDALKMVQTAMESKRTLLGESHYDTAEARGVMAMAMAMTGAREAALAEFAKAVPVLLERSNRSEIGGERQTAREFRLGLIMDAYIQLLASVHGTGLDGKDGVKAAEEAFRLADVARGRTVKRALAASSARAAAKDPDLADLARREQDALTQIGALNALLSSVLSAPAREQSPEGLKDIRARIDSLRSARDAIRKEIDTKFPDYANLMEPKPLGTEEARSNLRPGEALIATYVSEEGSYVWAIPQQGPAAFSSTGLRDKQIAEMVRSIRKSLDPQGGTLGSIPEFDLEKAYDLYDALLKPVEGGWKTSRNLLVVAHGALGFVPFSVLPTNAVTLGKESDLLFSNYRVVPWLARTHAITTLPSVASLRTLRGLSAGDPVRKAFIGFGNPYFSPDQEKAPTKETRVASAGTTRGMAIHRRGVTTIAPKQEQLDSAGTGKLSPLPDTAEEVHGIATALGANVEQDVFLGKKASEEQVKSMDLSRVKVLAFATHGLMPGELVGLSQPALALSSPRVTGGKEDGLLTLGEILGIRLNADWVVLSACNTGAGEGAGAEAVSGLGRGFFYAGTRALLVSNWPVETTSAKTLTTDLFRRQASDSKLTRSQALNLTMLDLIDKSGYINEKGQIVFSYAHPVFWAPFSLVGDGG